MRTQSTSLSLVRTRTSLASRAARTDAAVIARYIQDLTRTDGAEQSGELEPAV